MDASRIDGEFRGLVRGASIAAAFFALIAAGAYIYWWHVAERPLPPLSKNAVEVIKSSSNLEQVREMALILARADERQRKLFEDGFTSAVLLIIFLSALCAGFLVIFGHQAQKLLNTHRGSD
jgi:hypothetical protein